MDQVELENLVVRISGDSLGYQTMLKQSQELTKTVTQTVQGYSDQIKGFQSNLAGFASGALKLLGSFGLVTSLGGAFEKFVEFEKNQIKLKSAIEANGGAVEATMKEYEKFAGATAKSTMNTKGEVLGLLKQAEVLGLSGEAAEEAARSAVGLAAATDMPVESTLILAKAMQEGNTELLRRVRQLRGIKDETKLLEAAQRLVGIGLKQSKAELSSVGGQMEKLKKSLGGLNKEIGGIVSQAVTPFVKFLAQLVSQFNALDPSIKKIVVHAIILTAALLGLRPALSTVMILFKALGLQFVLTTAYQLANIVVWSLWTGIVLIAKGVILLFNLQMMAWNTIIGFSVFLLSGWSAATTIANIATWAWNAALAVMDALLAPEIILAVIPAILAFAGTVAVLSVGIVAAGVAIYAAWETATALWEVLANFPTTSGPIGAIVDIFSEWFGIIKDVIRAVQTDLPIAWKLIKAGFDLGVSQMKDLWPPLWAFIEKGFYTLGNLTAAQFEGSFLAAIGHIMQQLSELSKAAGIDIGINQELADNLVNEGARGRQLNIQIAKNQMAAALTDFKVLESEETKKARAEVQKIRDALGMKEEQDAKDRDARIGAAHVDAVKEETKAVDNVLSRSAESIRRIYAYRETIASQNKDTGITKTEPKFDAVPTSSKQLESTQRQELLLKEVRDSLLRQEKKVAVDVVVGAGLDA